MHLTNRNDYANMYVSPYVDTSTEYHHIFRIYYTTFSECNQADIVNFIRLSLCRPQYMDLCENTSFEKALYREQKRERSSG